MKALTIERGTRIVAEACAKRLAADKIRVSFMNSARTPVGITPHWLTIGDSGLQPIITTHDMKWCEALGASIAEHIKSLRRAGHSRIRTFILDANVPGTVVARKRCAGISVRGVEQYRIHTDDNGWHFSVLLGTIAH
jgi:hypothetical protein